MKLNDISYGVVIRVYPTYAILKLEDGSTGLLHISEVSNGFVRNFRAYVKVGNIYRVKVIEEDELKKFNKLSIKALSPKERRLGYNKEMLESGYNFEPLQAKLEEWMKGNI